MDTQRIDYQDDRFRIEDDSGAEWAIKRIAERQADTEAWRAHFETQLESIEAKNNDSIAYYTALLREYFDTVPHRKTKGGTEKYTLPSGELVMTPPTIGYERDEPTLTAWCRKTDPDLIKTVETPKWAEIKRLMKDDGVVPDGVTPYEVPATFSLKKR